MPQVPSSLPDPTLLQELCTVALQPEVADYLPFGLRERVQAYLSAPVKAESRRWIVYVPHGAFTSVYGVMDSYVAAMAWIRANGYDADTAHAYHIRPLPQGPTT